MEVTMTDGSDTATDGKVHFYVGDDDCKVASCPRKQEFPRAEDPYCLHHSLENWVEDNGTSTTGNQGGQADE
jgi:hypothetical protein